MDRKGQGLNKGHGLNIGHIDEMKFMKTPLNLNKYILHIQS